MSAHLPPHPFEVLIVAKTRLGPAGACIGGITQHGVSVRLIAADEATNSTFNQDYAVGDVWRIHACRRPAEVVPPHTEDVIVLDAEYVRHSNRLRDAIARFMPPHIGGPDMLYGGRLQLTEHGRFYITAEGIPDHSTCFWRPDRDLTFCTAADAKFRYSYPGDAGPLYFAYVGVEPPAPTIPAGSLVRMSLARWWQPPDKSDAPPRCYAQVSGWIELSAQESVPADPAVAIRPGGAHPAAPVAPSSVDLHHALRAYFGFDGFRPYQQEIIAATLQGRDTLVIMSTGAGKSLCYQLPAVVQDGLTVVVSPLISLMDDQVLHLQQMGIPAAALHSNRPPGEAMQTVRQVRVGRLKLLYMAPEALLTPERLHLLGECDVKRLVIDEAHCVSEWGHDFRPEYRRLAEVRERFPALPVMALTATATPRVREDILANLSLRDADIFIAPFDRPNLYLAAAARQGDGLAQIQDFLRDHRDQTGIIYCQTRNHVDLVAEALQEAGIAALPYHAGLDDVTRADHQRRFTRDEVQVIVATVAFGMGIDKPDIRFVLHYSLPLNLESYFQQIGRAGRDGDPADCLLLHAPNDVRTARFLLAQGDPETQTARERLLQQLVDWVHTTTCRRHAILTYFGDRSAADSCTMCDNCAARNVDTVRIDVTDYARLVLECVRDTGEYYTANYVVKILRGSEDSAIHDLGHNRLRVYGRGTVLSRDEWRNWIDRFMREGMLGLGGQKNLVLTERGRAILNGGSAMMLSESSPNMQSRTRRQALTDVQHDTLLSQLKALRRRVAEELHIPPYMVFSDRSLREMALLHPTTQDEFLRIYGVGYRKLEQFGAAFLKLLTGRENAALISRRRGNRANQRRQQALEALSAGRTLDDTAAICGVKPERILLYLKEYLEDGHKLPTGIQLPEPSCSAAMRRKVFASFDRLGLFHLAPVFTDLEGQVHYVDLHLLRILYLVERRE
jgi:ATP-dependent DNA helicase RecQ